MSERVNGHHAEPIDGLQAKGSLLDSEDSSALSLIAHFRKCARKSGLSMLWADKVIRAASTGDYDYFVGVLSMHLYQDEVH